MDQEAKQARFRIVFARLQRLLQPYEPSCRVSAAPSDQYMLTIPATEANQNEVFFGGVQVKKNYVSYHLMAVYLFPQLLDGVSDRLKKQMQGKSCFNFTKVDEELLSEVAQLTQRSAEHMQHQGLLAELQ